MRRCLKRWLTALKPGFPSPPRISRASRIVWWLNLSQLVWPVDHGQFSLSWHVCWRIIVMKGKKTDLCCMTQGECISDGGVLLGSLGYRRDRIQTSDVAHQQTWFIQSFSNTAVHVWWHDVISYWHGVLEYVHQSCKLFLLWHGYMERMTSVAAGVSPACQAHVLI